MSWLANFVLCIAIACLVTAASLFQSDRDMKAVNSLCIYVILFVLLIASLVFFRVTQHFVGFILATHICGKFKNGACVKTRKVSLSWSSSCVQSSQA